MIIESKLTDDNLLAHIYKAAAEYEKLIDKSFLIIGKNRNTDYYWFECQFEKKNFMHLLGIKSKIYNAEDFFDKCKEYNRKSGTGLTIKDCTPSRNHSRTTVNEKSSVCADILKMHEARYLKIGDKDKILEYVDFTDAFGNDVTLGFKKDCAGPSFPLTLIPKNIDTFLPRKYKVIFVFAKKIKDKKYKELYTDLPVKLQEKITI